jgi:NitT/TauT family transport system ATP-binding protein
VTRIYETAKGRIVAVEDLSLAVAECGFVCIVGPSGCGKSTFLRMVAGLEEITSGSIDIRPGAVPGTPLNSVVFQEYAIFPWKTVIDNVMLGVKYRPGSRRNELEAICRSQLEHVGLAQFVNYYPYQLSGGMQQRVAIARALARRPELLLMDEPFSALDAMMRVELQDLLLKLWDEIGLTILFVTHDLDEALYLARRVVVMSASPGMVADIVDVPLPYPRNQVHTRSDPVYLQLRKHLYRLMVEQATAPPAGQL